MVRQHPTNDSNWRSEISFNEWLIKNDIPLNLSVCLSYLTSIFKMSSISHSIIISASENKPLNIEIQTNDSNKYNYYIAPKY